MLNILTKINKGTLESITAVELIKKGERVGSSESALLSELRIRPFSYGLVVQSVYDNESVFSPEVLSLQALQGLDVTCKGLPRDTACRRV